MPEFSTYIGVKMVEAKPMNLGDYNRYREWTQPENEDPSREGYLVVYKDGYESWCPKEAFEEANVQLIKDQNDLPILKYFSFEHLPEQLQKISMPFAYLAFKVANMLPVNAETSAGLRKLLEAKDCAVRAKV